MIPAEVFVGDRVRLKNAKSQIYIVASGAFVHPIGRVCINITTPDGGNTTPFFLSEFEIVEDSS